ncbi:MAG: SUMF1/EgtB/PvdO family nonheme iron enzyme [Muribaculaceae bacterium]|nr:SUMF1/EgtB/PvdO family nonheme iron enzyme [Muribaculaceae bacterium]
MKINLALSGFIILLALLADSCVQNAQTVRSETFTVKGVSFDMVYVEEGTFNMGATAEQAGDAYEAESPVHKVKLNDYYIGRHEVTQALWKAVMGNNPSIFKGDNLPVEHVCWNDCQAFIQELNRLTGKQFLLPTEAHWEYAARGGSTSARTKYAGSQDLNQVCWYYENSDMKTHPVGTKLPNELGIYDMSGNVSEWCNDWYSGYTVYPKTNPAGPKNGYYYVVRGGGWLSNARNNRVSNRSYGNRNTGYRLKYLGFRLVLIP